MTSHASLLLTASGFVTPSISLLVWFWFHRALLTAPGEATRAARTRLSLLHLGLLLLWFGLAFGLAINGVFENLYGSALVLVFAYGPPLLGIRFVNRSKLLGAAADSLANHWLVAIQVYRLLGIMFLVLWWQGRMPAEFAFPSGIGDIIIGSTAPVVAYMLVKRKRGHQIVARWWNYVGLADLVVAMTAGPLTAPTLLQSLSFDRPNDLIISFPLVMVPTFAVPFAGFLHLVSLRILKNRP